MRAATLALWALVALGAFATGADAQGQSRPKADLLAVVETTPVVAGGTTRVAVQVTLPAGFHVQSNQPADKTVIPTILTIVPAPGVTVRRIIYPVAREFTVQGLDAPLLVFDGTFVVGAEVEIAPGMPAGDVAVTARLRYQACDDQVCYMPATMDTEWTLTVAAAGASGSDAHSDIFSRLAAGIGVVPPAPRQPETPGPRPQPDGGSLGIDVQLDGFVIRATTGGYLGADAFLQFIADAESGVAARGPFEGRGPIAILVLILLGGLALNLTPCVLPMIPINLAIIGAGSQAGSRRRGFSLGLAYGGAMALVYGVLGLVVILTAGTFGTINASPWFNAAIAVLFVILALAMFDVIPIDFSSYSSGFRPNGRGTFGLAFTMGGVAALLAGACVAPVVIQVILFASSLYAGGTTLALALPFALGVGMALPWPVAGAGLASLPKPGAWMVRVKQAFGIFILATAAYYGYVTYTIVANRWVDAADVSNSVQDKLSAGWTASLAEGLARAERDRVPVLIDFWPTWCKNCLTMDTTTLASPEVTSALSRYVKIKVQAEDPDAVTTKTLMARFNAIGLPTYVILYPSERNRVP